jgi:hypothetical protein
MTLLKQGLLVTSVMLAAMQAHSFSFYNDLDNNSFKVSIDGSSDFNQTVAAKGTQSCNWANTDCNPGGNRYNVLTANITIDSLDFYCKINFQAGGHVRVRYNDGYVQCHSYDVGGSTRDVNPVQVSNNSRDVRFLATADPQYDNGNHTRNAVANDTLGVMANMIKSANDIRGLLVAGDLTQNSRKDERNFFEDATWRIRDYLYEGMGNHDDEDPTWYQRLACPLLSSCVSPGDIMDSIDHKRNNLLLKEQHDGGLYSWDWQDVHVVQLGTFIANEPRPNTSSDKFDHISPYNSLSFLKSDLANNVGKTGRPIILMSHYGFDGFSNGWWTEDQRRKMWDALDGYNVVAIFSGHSHRYPTSQWHFTVNRPSGTNKGPNSILNIVAGAALFKAFVDVDINGNTMNLKRMTFDANNTPYSVGSTSINISNSYQPANHSVRYQNVDNNNCLQASGSQVTVVGCGSISSGADKWVYEEGQERIRNIETNKCLYISGGNRLVETTSCNSNSNQKWFWSSNELKNRSNNQCLDLFRSQGKAGVWGCHGGNNQKWREVLR